MLKMKVYRKSAIQSLADRLGQALVEHMDIGRLSPDFYHVELQDNGGFSLSIICGQKNENKSDGLYKSYTANGAYAENRFEFEFTPITPVLNMNGKEYGYLIALKFGWLWDGAKAVIEKVLGTKLVFACNSCYGNCIIDPNSKPDDFYVNDGYVHTALVNDVNIPVLVQLYNQKFNKSHVVLQDLLNSFWRDQFSTPLADIKSLTVNGYPLGAIIADQTHGKFWSLE